MSRRWASASLAFVCVALIASGLSVGLSSVHRDGLMCGRAFSSNNGRLVPDFSKAMDGILYGSGDPHACAASLSARRDVSIGLLVLGGVLVAVVVAVGVRGRRRS
jgi:hypothetical protein